MRKIPVIVGGLILAMAFAVTVQIVYTLLHQTKIGLPDQTENVNVMLTRSDRWRKLVDGPVIPESDMEMIDGSTATIPVTAELLRQFYGYSDQQVDQSEFVRHSTTHRAYMNLIERQSREVGYTEVSLIFVTAPSEEERRSARNRDVELELTPIALDGFVFITHKDNPVDMLTVDQIRDIYSGVITNWREVGGEDREILAYQREENSGSQTAMEQLVMKGRPIQSPIGVAVYFGMGFLVDAVAEYDNGPASIGYTYQFYLNNLYRNGNVKVLKIDGIAPTDANLISGRYPLATNYYAVLRADEPAGSPARKLAEFLVTEQGQDLIAMAGYCKIWGEG